MHLVHIIGMTLNEYLADKAMSDAEFGALIGRDQSTVSRLRRGKTRPDWATMHVIADKTDGAVTPNDFLPESAIPAGVERESAA